MKNSKVLIVPNEQGTIIRESSNKEIHYGTNNFIKKVALHCNVFAPLELLKSEFDGLESLPGKLYVVESFAGKDDDIKRAGADGPELLGLHPNGEELPIYRKVCYDITGLKKDILIPHTNVEEIREYNALQEA